MTVLEHVDEREQEQLSGLLKRCRARLDPARPALGPFLRLPNRIGKAITQEEVAEAAGITRQWYAMLESDRPVHVSAPLVARIADVLMMEPVERSALFRLALPELRNASLTDRSTAILDAFGSMRRVTRRLWAATTEAEALTIVREHALTQLEPDVMVTCTRIEDGRWDRATTGDDRDRVRLHALICERCHPGAIDDFHCYPFLSQPGEVMTRSERDAHFRDLAELRHVLDAVEWGQFSCAMVHVRSQHGFVSQLQAVHHTAHAFSETERALLSTLADLTSLALSGCVSR